MRHRKKSSTTLGPRLSPTYGAIGQVPKPTKASKIGKHIGGCIYVHRQYESVLPAALLKCARRGAPGFAYDVVKYDEKAGTFTFISVPGFDTEPEPVMGQALLVRPDGTTRQINPPRDPWVYHHKAAFVGADYTGFDLAAARRRQRQIDSLPDVDKSRIGKYSVNQKVTAGLSGVERNNVAATSVRQVPALMRAVKWEKGTINADVGGGKFEEGTNLLATFGVKNLVYDPYSRPDTYEAVGRKLTLALADTGTLANVLNVIEDEVNRLHVLDDLCRFVKPGGQVYISIYEGNRSGVGANTKTGSWQNNRSTKTYLAEVMRVFPDAKVTKGNIVATVPGGLSGVRRQRGGHPEAYYRPGGLAGPYKPVSEGLPSLSSNTEWPVIVPDSMDTETHSAMRKLREAVGGDVAWFVQDRLGYRTPQELGSALMAEQVDAVALCIYNIEVRNEGIVIADQTGIGKGRIAAAMIRYAHRQGKMPIFLTEKANLFTDIYRDLTDIGSGQLRPYIVNARDDKSSVKDADGNVRYTSASASQQRQDFTRWGEYEHQDNHHIRYDLRDADGKVANVVLATYSQFNQGFDWKSAIKIKKGGKAVTPSYELLPPKCKFLVNFVRGQILILDESHNASGDSNTGGFLQQLLALAQGVTFLSATYAKRPDNMVVYSTKTVLAEAKLPPSKLIFAIRRGGVGLQEIISSQLVAGGQLLRRERPYAGVEVNWNTLTEQAAVHRARTDAMTAIMRDLIDFQNFFVNPVIEDMALSMTEKVGKTQGTDEGGISNTPMFSRVFNLIFQLLFSIKAEAVAAHAISRMREGKKVLITFQSTMGAFMEHTKNEQEAGDEGGNGGDSDLQMEEGSRVKATFDVVLERLLLMTMAYSTTDTAGKKHKYYLVPRQLGEAGEAAHAGLLSRIKQMTTDINVSPIDLLTKIIREAGFKVAEVTGRNLYMDLADDNRTGVVRRRARENTADAFRRFNNNEADCLLLNAAGSTGASAHAVTTSKVPASQVKQRVMIIHQPSLDINTEVQKRGRVFRTGQLMPPIYDYLVSAIPAEQRLMMMLQRKLKSLDANTTSNQKNSAKLVDTQEFADFLNHHGDKIVAEYLLENERMNLALGDAINKYSVKVAITDDGDKVVRDAPEDFAMKVSGRVAVLATAKQQEFYADVSERYKSHINYLNEIGQNDLEVKDMDLRAVILDRTPKLLGQGGRSAFGGAVYREKVTVRNLTKPMSGLEVRLLVQNELEGQTADQLQQKQIADLVEFFAKRISAYKEGYDWQRHIDAELARKKVNKSLKNSDPQAYEEIVDLIRNDQQTKLDGDIKAYEKQRSYLLALFRRFKVGHGYKVPNPDLPEHKDSGDYIAACFLGFGIDNERYNPYTLSNLQLRFALASPQRSLTLPAGSPLGKSAFYASSSQYAPWNGPLSEGTWQNLILRESADTETRYILSGNVLLALGNDLFKGWRLSLISFTMLDGTVRKGILMPRKYNELADAEGKPGMARFVVQSLGATGLAERLEQIFTDEMRNTNTAPVLQLSTASGLGLLSIRPGRPATGGGFYADPTPANFHLWAGWNDGGDKEVKQLIKSGELLVALTKSYELAKVGGYQSSTERRFQSEFVPLPRMSKVLKVLGQLGLYVQLSQRLLDDYPDLMPANREHDSDTWPVPPNMPSPRREPITPWLPPTAAPPAAGDDRARKLKLAQARIKILALALAAKARVSQLAGVLHGRRPPKAAIAHSRIKKYL